MSARPADSVTITGRPIVYALSVPSAAPHPDAANRLAAYLLSREGRSMMRAAHVDAIDGAVFVGAAIPGAVRAAGQ
jgi:ABC-type molybdate transport system substrate-binding protein